MLQLAKRLLSSKQSATAAAAAAASRSALSFSSSSSSSFSSWRRAMSSQPSLDDQQQQQQQAEEAGDAKANKSMESFAFVAEASGASVTSRDLFRKIIRAKPFTPGQRGHVKIDRSELYSGKPVKSLTVGLRQSGGRNNQGRITVWQRGGGHKRKYRLVDFKRRVFDVPAKVLRLEYDPNRSAHIALLEYEDEHSTLSYIIAPQGLQEGDVIMSTWDGEVDIRVGNAMPLSKVPIGTDIHCVELQPGRGAQLARSAGAVCRLLEKNAKPGFALVRIASKESRYIPLTCMATIGQVSNPLHKLRKLGKAGRKRWLGRRPTVRGVAMNPVDHPHGGGEGKTSGGRPSVTPWGVYTKGVRTRKKPRNPLVVVRRGGARGKR
eukprot:TRINITY_DN66784_c5_g7_i1.p1 TRINITY_DN66784_c5_g7~~TRINITY_DN66784_c5_g7_i1.p1  ORF type:complete len:386 (-),score=158.09 TRINITY_DN66784_c5_g7_i1:58-1191(-)